MSYNLQSISGAFLFRPANIGNSRPNFGKETVSKINSSRNVHLNGTTVTEKVNTSGNITATNANIGKINVSGNATLTSTICNGKVNASGSITANRCNQLGSVKAGTSVTLDECPSVHSVSGHDVTLQQAVFQGNVSTVDATIENSKVVGTLTCVSNHLIIEGSEIDTINLRCPRGFSIRSEETSAGNRGIFISRRTSGNRGIFMRNSVSVIGNSFVSINNGIIKASGNLSKIFIDGVPLSRSQSEQASSKKEDKPRQTLELRNCN